MKVSGGIRILVENGEYPLRNRGDIAMLSITVQRLRESWPDARIGVLTNRPALLRAFIPDAEPVDCRRGCRWPTDDRLRRSLSARGARVLGPLSERGRAAAAGPWRRLRPVRAAVRPVSPMSVAGIDDGDDGISGDAMHRALRDVSLVVAGGGGYMTDADLHQAHRTLHLLDHACSQGIPTAMVGQGIGPMANTRLLEHAARVLPHLDLIALREGRRGPKLLEKFGVAPEKVVVTGDDAVEFGYRVRTVEAGSDLGLCLRTAAYSKVAAGAPDIVGRVVRNAAADLNAGLAPLIVSEHGSEDRRSTLPLLEGYHDTKRPIGRFGSAERLARQVAGCRVLVTSTYHVAVFAMSQGIPVVGLSSSAYYDDKFLGLAEMFGVGLTLVHLDGDNLDDRLGRAIRRSWQEADGVRNPLRYKAVEQMKASRAAFERIARLVVTSSGAGGQR
jgi:polysaccharide pyruvyl transferase WcaK-like protein